MNLSEAECVHVGLFSLTCMHAFNLLHECVHKYVHVCLRIYLLYALACSKVVSPNHLKRLISKMKDAELSALQDMILLFMQRVSTEQCRLWPWKLSYLSPGFKGLLLV